MAGLRLLFAFVALQFILSCESVNQPNNDLTLESMSAAAAAAQFDSAAQRIEADVRYLADDARMGREAGTQGYNDAANYVAARMASMGLKPAGNDGGWFQQVPLRSAVGIREAGLITVESSTGEKTILNNIEDFLVAPMGGRNAAEITAPAVFVGYGVHAPEEGHDDFAGLDLNGKIVINIIGSPDHFASEKRAYYASNSVKRKFMANRGAVGVIALRDSRSMERVSWERISSNPERVGLNWIGPDGAVNTNYSGLIAAALMNGRAAPLLFDGAALSYEEVLAAVDAKGVSPESFDLAVNITMKAAIRTNEIESANVIGLIEGSDPELKNEFVVLSAHLDHTGVNQSLIQKGEDGINNGALDNAMGVATMLEAAQMLTMSAPPERSVIFLAVTAEEKGLVGADYFAHFPTVPPGSIVANVNLDMPIVLYDFTDVVAFGAERSSLGPMVEKAAANIGIKLSPDPIPEQNLFLRSDHYRFVQQGIPSVFLVTGFENGGGEMFQEFLSTHYHRPSDDISLPIRYDAAVRFADVNFQIAKEIANAPERPGWNDGDFFGELFAGGE